MWVKGNVRKAAVVCEVETVTGGLWEYDFGGRRNLQITWEMVHIGKHFRVCFSEGYYGFDETPWWKATWARKGSFHLHFHILVHHQEQVRQELKQGRNLEAGTGAEAQKKWCLVACSSLLAESASWRNPWPLTQGGTTHNRLGPLTSFTN